MVISSIRGRTNLYSSSFLRDLIGREGSRDVIMGMRTLDFIPRMRTLDFISRMRAVDFIPRMRMLIFRQKSTVVWVFQPYLCEYWADF